MVAKAENWRPYRNIASLYPWRASESDPPAGGRGVPRLRTERPFLPQSLLIRFSEIPATVARGGTSSTTTAPAPTAAPSQTVSPSSRVG